MPAFFIPNVATESQEQFYSDLARSAGCNVPPAGERIYSVTFRHNREIWTATVGEKLRGVRLVKIGRGRAAIERELPVYDDATVLAIFPNDPFFVCHDQASRQWENPFMIGNPRNIIRFEGPE